MGLSGLFSLSIAYAQSPITVNNFSFEANVASVGGDVTSVPTGWTAFNEAGSSDIGSENSGGTQYTVNNPLAAPADGNQYCYINMFNPSVTGGIYQDVGALQPNTTYTLTVAIGSRADRINSPGIISLVNGADDTGTVLASGGGLPGTQNTWQDYTVNFTTGASVSGDLTIVLSVLGNGTTIQADFDNVQLTALQRSVPEPVLIQNTTPASDTVAMGSNAVFTAAFSNSPPVNLQWLQIVSGSPNTTNNINTGVVNVTNNGVVTSTLTLSDVPLSSSGTSYQLEAVNATNNTGVPVYTRLAPLTVVSTITWYPSGAGNGVFSTDSVLGYAGTVGNEVYGVDFGGSGAVTTGNGYTFNDYVASGNMTIANSAGLVNNTGYEGGSVTTGDAGLDTILDYGVTGSATCTATLNNLTVGQAYTVLVLMDDNRTSGAGGPDFDVTDGLTASPAQDYAFPNGVPAVGGFIMGKFTAQSTSQPLTALEDGNAQYIAVLLEKGTAPAPVTAPTLTSDVDPLVSKLSPGAPVTLTVGVSGSPLSYQWSNQSGPVSGATNASYSFNASSGPGSYNTNSYFCTVTNTAGSIVSSTAEVITSTNIVSVYNFSFENDVAGGPGGVVKTVPSSWAAFNEGGSTDIGSENAGGTDYTVFDPLAAPADGNQFCYVNMFVSGVTGGIYQDVGALKPNTTYTLTVAIGNRNDAPPNGQPAWSPGIISLVNGANNTGTVLVTGGGLPATANSWQDYTITYSTGSSVSGDLTVELSVAGSPSIQADFDNVQLAQAPAPPVVAPTLTTDISPLASRLTTGTPVTFTVSANGFPLDYQWYNQNGPISGATNASYSFNSSTGTNSYYVAVTNSAGATNSSTAVVVSSPNIVTVQNYDFQNTTLNPGQTIVYTPNGPAGWNGFNIGSGGNYDIGLSYASGGDFTDPLTTPAFGNNYLWVNRFNGNGTQVAGVYQDVGSLKANTTYTLTVAIGQRASTGPDGSWSPGIISLVNGTSDVGTVLVTGGGLPATANSWQDYTASFTTGASVSGDLTVVLSVLDAPSIQGDFSNVQLTQVPQLVFNPPVISGGNLTLTASGGTAGGGYTLLTTTNLLGPWTTNSTGTFSGTGTLSSSIPIGTGHARFFLLRTP